MGKCWTMSKEGIKKIRLSKLGDKNPAKRPEIRKKISETLTGYKHSKETMRIRKLSGVGKWNIGSKRNDISKQKMRDAKLKNPTQYWLGKKIPSTTKRKIREKIVKYIIQNGTCKIGTNEKEILDQLEYELDTKIERQYSTCGYLIDGYFKKNNIAFEVDERGHLFKQEKDIQRQQIIEKELGCKFIRIQDY